MRVRYLTSACVIIETQDSKILCDPWLSETAFYGAWAHAEPLNVRWDELADITGIYISHIHNDHFDPETLKRLPKVPVYVAPFKNIPLAKMIRGLGFEAIELPWWETRRVGDMAITMLRPDGLEIDSAALFRWRGQAVLNMVDVQMKNAASILEWLPDVLEGLPPDVLLAGYSGAGSYPHCFDFSPAFMAHERDRMTRGFLDAAADMVRAVKPKVFVPFAGEYRLRGRLAGMNPDRPMAERSTLADREEFKDLPCELVIPKTGEWLDGGGSSWAAERDDNSTLEEMFKDGGRNRRALLDYEREDEPSKGELSDAWNRAVPEWYSRTADRNVAYPLNWFLRFGTDFVVSGVNAKHYHRFEMDPRQLYGALTGRYHWNNLLGSSQIRMSRTGPFDFDLYYAMSFFHCSKEEIVMGQ